VVWILAETPCGLKNVIDRLQAGQGNLSLPSLFGDEEKMAELAPFALKDTPSLIEAVYPVQKISFEAQQERTSVQSQTLTGLGSYWKGRKPLILVRSIILGSLLPQTNNREKDLELFEMLLGFDPQSLAKRAITLGSIKPIDIISSIDLHNPWGFFSHNLKGDNEYFREVSALQAPFNSNELGLKVRWRKDIDDNEKIPLFKKYLDGLTTYEEKSLLCKRPEECDQVWLYDHIWGHVNTHLSEFSINAYSFDELVRQLGILRFGHKPKVGDVFSGGGSIPFEAARLGCDAFASDLNPIACMLTWGTTNIIGAPTEERKKIENAQQKLVDAVEEEIASLGLEHDSKGNRAKAYLCCLETKCPETGWVVPLIPSLVVSKSRNVIAKLRPNYDSKTFSIDIVSDVTPEILKNAEKGTIQDGCMVYELEGHTYRTPIKTIRGDYRDTDKTTKNRLRKWSKSDFMPSHGDVFQERIYAIQWITKNTLALGRQETYFSSVSDEDIARERKIESIVEENIGEWQAQGIIPDLEIEAGYNTDQPKRERGWQYWHHLFSPRQLLIASIVKKKILEQPMELQAPLYLSLAKMLDWSSKLCRYGTGAARESITQTFYNQAYNTNYSYGVRSFVTGKNYLFLTSAAMVVKGHMDVENNEAACIDRCCDLWITDPPYADAVNYDEMSEFFIGWLRRNPPQPFNEWTWDSRRALAIKGSGDGFRKGMVSAYKTMADRMTDGGMQCVMFTHQDISVWSDMIGIFWASGLQVVGAWYIATETSTELKKGGYVQGTVILMLRKRASGENAGFKQRLLPAVRAEVKSQIETMMHLNDEIKDKLGEPVFNDSDLQMAGYAAALKVLTSYTHIGGEDVTSFALRPRTKGEMTVVDEIVQQAAEAANSLLVPDGLSANAWQKMNGIQRFYLRMMDIETTGASKLDNYQNFAKAFRVEDYSRIMGNMAANKAQLKRIPEFTSRDLTDSTELGASWLGHLIIGLQQILDEKDPKIIIGQLQLDLPDFMEVRPVLIDILIFIENKAPDKATRDAAEVLGARLKNMRALGQ
jgi:adenine-specific DNA methylase